MQLTKTCVHAADNALPVSNRQEFPEYIVEANIMELPVIPHSHTGAVAIVSLDSLGIVASTVCLIHCLTLPLLLSVLPLLGWQFLAGKGAHELLSGFVITFALCAIVPGYLQHRQTSILMGMVIGLSLVLVATFICGYALRESFEVPLITVGNLVLVATHWRNRKLSACRH